MGPRQGGRGWKGDGQVTRGRGRQQGEQRDRVRGSWYMTAAGDTRWGVLVGRHRQQ